MGEIEAKRAGDQPTPESEFVTKDIGCKICGYSLQGLPLNGACPECGTSVLRSLQGDLLVYSGADYVKSLHLGTVIIIVCLAVQVISMATILPIQIAVPSAVGILNWLLALLMLTSTASSFAMLWGWWLLSAPDPAFVGRPEDARVRRVVRAIVLIVAVISLLNFIIEQVPSASFYVSQAVVLLVGLVGFVVWIIKFFACMVYLRRLGPRLPSERIAKRAKVLMWAGPLLWTVGAFCIGIGPLVALVMYWALLDWIRKDLKRIRIEQERVGDGIPGNTPPPIPGGTPQ